MFTWDELMALGESISDEQLSAVQSEQEFDDPINIQLSVFLVPLISRLFTPLAPWPFSPFSFHPPSGGIGAVCSIKNKLVLSRSIERKSIPYCSATLRSFTLKLATLSEYCLNRNGCTP